MIEEKRKEKLNGEKGQFASLLDEYSFNPPKRGQILEGEVLQIDEKIVTVDIGSKRDALVPLDDLDDLREDRLDGISAGDQVPVYVTRPYTSDGKLLASIKKGFEMEDWQQAEACLHSEEVLDLRVIGTNRGGVKVQFGALEGFVPNSHLPTIRRIHDQEFRATQKEGLVGDSLCVKVIEVVPERERLILSARAAHQAQRDRRLQALEVGQIIAGPVVNIVDFGVFVDLGGVDGLVHISELGWERVEHPSDVLEVGDVIEVSIQKVDLKKSRVSLSRKPLLPNPWEAIVEQHQEGDLVEGVISNVCDFGAFVKLNPGIEGLIHISEIDIPAETLITDVVQVGDKVLAKIVSLDPFRERIGMSLSRVTEGEQVVWMEAQADEELSAPVVETGNELARQPDEMPVG